MKRKQIKRPAHEVLLNSLEDAADTFRRLNMSPEGQEVSLTINISRISLLRSIMRNMVIPAKDLEATLGALRRLKGEAGDSVVADMISGLLNEMRQT